MSKYLGVDWASRGWFGVILYENDEYETDFFPSIWSLWKYHSDATQILIDIPIGLPYDSKRACDIQAREKMGPRQSSVFYTPVRDAVYKTNLKVAKAVNEEMADFSIQNQSWSIVPRIREVDEFLDTYPNAQDRLFETHPEVCFHALNDGTPLDSSKQTESGVEQRKSILEDEYDSTAEIYHDAIEQYTEPRYAPLVSHRNDILDALVAAVVAKEGPEEWATLPDIPPTDERGLPMQIVYPSASTQTQLSTLDMHES